MRYCADTWFFIELSKNASEAKKIMRSLGKKKNILVVPTVTILVLTRLAIKTGRITDLKDLLNAIEQSDFVKVIDCDLEIAEYAGQISATFGIPTVDSIIAATTIKYNCHKLISKDTHFQILKRHKLVKVLFW